MKKKMYLAAVVGTFALLSGAQVFAAPPAAELEVKGLLKTPGCQVIAGDSNGVYDYGALSPTLIKPGSGAAARTELQPITQTWTVSCDAPTYLTYQVIDNQAETVDIPHEHRFGLGHINTTGNIGFYTIYLSNAKVDDKKTYVLWIRPASSNANVTRDAGNLDKNFAMSWTTTSGVTAMPVAGKEFVMDMGVTAVLSGTGEMNGAVTENVPLNGSATINYAFGI